MKRLVLAALAALCLLSGCVGPSRFGNVEQELSHELGRMTLDEAIDRYGEPNSIDQGELLTVAYWQHTKSGGIVTERLYLTFDNQTKKLKVYRYNEKAFD